MNHTIDYEYDKNNYLTKSTITFSNGNVYSVSEYENNEKGDPVKLSVYYDNSDKPSVITEYEYDGQGTIVKVVTVEQESNYRSINEYEKGEIVKVSRYDGNGNLYDLIEYSYEYNDDGSIKSFIYKSYDEIEKYYYEYDANGNVLSLKEYDQDDNLVLAYIYEYIKK